MAGQVLWACKKSAHWHIEDHREDINLIHRIAGTRSPRNQVWLHPRLRQHQRVACAQKVRPHQGRYVLPLDSPLHAWKRRPHNTIFHEPTGSPVSSTTHQQTSTIHHGREDGSKGLPSRAVPPQGGGRGGPGGPGPGPGMPGAPGMQMNMHQQQAMLAQQNNRMDMMEARRDQRVRTGSTAAAKLNAEIEALQARSQERKSKRLTGDISMSAPVFV
ncbi:hypothetical protein PM082_022255 [Marasmius tenuissimus]|nr:hypothetical protein PM082_022255 [Marasmius tenuissimus]